MVDARTMHEDEAFGFILFDSILVTYLRESESLQVAVFAHEPMQLYNVVFVLRNDQKAKTLDRIKSRKLMEISYPAQSFSEDRKIVRLGQLRCSGWMIPRFRLDQFDHYSRF